MGDFNARIGSSDSHLKVVGKHAYHQETNNNGARLIHLCEANNMCIATTRKPHPNRHKWSWQQPNGNKAQKNHILLKGKWINSLRNCRCYKTVELDSDHRILTASIKFSFRTTKKISNIPIYDHKAVIYNNAVQNNFQLELSNRFQHLQIDEDDSTQTAYNKFEKAVNEAVSHSLLKKQKTTKKF